MQFVQHRRNRPGSRPTSVPSWLEVIEQFALVFGAALLYFFVRGLTETGPARAIRHGMDVLRLERHLGIDVEAGVQTLVLSHHWLVTLANWVYIWGHWPVIAVSLFWLHREHRSDYLVLRNGLFLSGAVGLVIFALYPVAPPRLLPLPLVDTVTRFSTSYRVLQPTALVNKYAAMPSLHVGWNIIVGLTMFRIVRRRAIRVVMAVLPALMVFAVIATANHFVLDTIVGATVALLGLLAAHRLDQRRPAHSVRGAPVAQLADELDVVHDEPADTP